MLLEQHIEELHRELNWCHPDERREIAAELELAQAELAVIMAEQDGSVRCRTALLRATIVRQSARNL